MRLSSFKGEPAAGPAHLGSTGIGFATWFRGMAGRNIHLENRQADHMADHLTNRFADGLLVHLLALSLLLAVALLTGCATPPMEHPSEAAVPWETDQPWQQAESSVLYTPDALQEMAWNNQDVDDARWYDSRNDSLDSVYAGQRTRIVSQRSVTYTATRQGTSRGRVIDNSYQNTYTRRVEELTR